jgi:hypothetical protein
VRPASDGVKKPARWGWRAEVFATPGTSGDNPSTGFGHGNTHRSQTGIPVPCRVKEFRLRVAEAQAALERLAIRICVCSTGRL